MRSTRARNSVDSRRTEGFGGTDPVVTKCSMSALLADLDRPHRLIQRQSSGEHVGQTRGPRASERVWMTPRRRSASISRVFESAQGEGDGQVDSAGGLAVLGQRAGDDDHLGGRRAREAHVRRQQTVSLGHHRGPIRTQSAPAGLWRWSRRPPASAPSPSGVPLRTWADERIPWRTLRAVHCCAGPVRRHRPLPTCACR